MPTSNASGRVNAGLLIVIAALAAALGLWFGKRWFAGDETGLQSLLLYPSPRDVPEFSIDRADGSPLTRADLLGRWSVVFVGFTQCPDICPTTLSELKQAWTQWQSQQRGDRVRVVFLSVDPQRDTPEILKNYTAYFSPDFIAATADDDRLQKLTTPLGIVYARTPDDKGGYSVDHSANLLLIDPQGRLTGLFRPGSYTPATLVADINAMMDAKAR